MANSSPTYNLIPRRMDELDYSFLNTKYVDWLTNEGFEESEIYPNGTSNHDGWFAVSSDNAEGNISRDTAIVHAGAYSAKIEKNADDNFTYVDLEYKWIRFNDTRTQTKRDEWFRINYWIYRTQNVSVEPIIAVYNASATPPTCLGNIPIVPSDVAHEYYDKAMNLDTSLNAWVQKSTWLADRKGNLARLLDPTGSDASGYSLIFKIKFRLREKSTVYLDDVEFRNYDAYGGAWKVVENEYIRFTTDEPINHSSIVCINPINGTCEHAPLIFETIWNIHLSPSLDSLVAFVVTYNRTLNDVIGFKHNASGTGKMDIISATSVNLENCSFTYDIAKTDLIEYSSIHKIRMEVSSSSVKVTVYDANDVDIQTLNYNTAMEPKGVGFLVYVSPNQTGYVDFLTLKSNRIRDVNVDAFTEVGLVFPLDYDWSSAPALRYQGGKYKLWYRQRENFQRGRGIGYAESPDLRNWVRYGQVFSNSTTMTDVKSFERAVVNILSNGTYFMHYSMRLTQVGSLDHRWEMGLAISQNGINWTDRGKLTYDGSYAWAKDFAVLYDDGYLYLYDSSNSIIYRSTNGLNFTTWKTDRETPMEVRKFEDNYYFYKLDWSGTLSEAIRTTPDTSPSTIWTWNNTYTLRDCNITGTKPYVSVEKVGYKWIVFYDLQYKWWFQPDPDSQWRISNNVYRCKIFFATYPGTPPEGLSLTIENMEDVGKWVFAEKKYYEFKAKAQDLGLDFAEITVSFSDGAGWINVAYDCVDAIWSIESGEDLVSIENGSVSLEGMELTVTFHIHFKSAVLDALGVDLYLKVVDTENWQFGLWKAQEDYFNVYNRARMVADAGSDQMVDEDTLVVLDGSSSSNNVFVKNYTWTFIGVTQQMLTGVKSTFNFTTPGIYTIALNVTDVAGNYHTDTVTITVLDITKPVANAGENQTANVGELVTFDAGASTDNVGITNYDWNFGDDTNGTGVIAYCTYTEPGTYAVMLTVRDAAGNVDTDETIITVIRKARNTSWIVGAVVAVLAAGIGATLALWKRRELKKRVCGSHSS